MQTYEAQIEHYKGVKARMSSVAPGREDEAQTEEVAADEEPVVEEPERVIEPPTPRVVVERIPGPSRYRNIAREVCAKHGLNFRSVAGPSRIKKFCSCRHELCFRLRHELGVSLPAIGRYLGNRDHSTVLNSIKRFKQTAGASSC